MIIKGGSRSGPEQLAWHLQRRDTNERVDILELQSLSSDLTQAFRDWQILVEGTHGTKGLYHANIDPAGQYTMTLEQWWRAVEVLEKELGFEGQDRAVILHQKYDSEHIQIREHLHVVWQRTDIDTMTLRSDSQNYQAHERASQKLELEFGHEHVPGKHAKRDREKQPEFPRAESNHAEWQQGERTGLNPAARKDQITALKQASDSAQAFKAALEEHGYILANGQRGFIIVDQAGGVYALTRQIRAMKPADVREFMKPIDRESLPTVEQAKETQKEARKQAEAQASAEPPADIKPPESAADTVQAQRDAEIEALRKAVAGRHEEETRRLVETHTAELNQLRQTLDVDTREKLDRLDATHKAQAEAQRLRLRLEQAPAGIFETVQDFFSAARAAEREADLKRAQEQLAARQKQERNEYAALLQQTGKLETENLTERQALALHDHAIKGEQDLERYLREHEAARQLQTELKEQERQHEEELTWDALDMKAPHAEALPTAEQAADIQQQEQDERKQVVAKQTEKAAPEQQSLIEEKKALSPDEIQALQKTVAERQPREVADILQSQQHEIEALQQQTQDERKKAAEEQAEKPAREQQPLIEEKKALPPDEIEDLQKSVVERQQHDAANGPERQQVEFERMPQLEAERVRFQRENQITAVKQRSPDAEAFRRALADEGYILASGDRGELMVVDRTGAVHGLAGEIPGMAAAEFQEFMKGIDRATLPSVQQATEIHRQGWEEKQRQDRAEAAALDQPAQQQPEKKEALRPSREEEMEALKKAVADRQTRDAAEMADRHKAEYQRTRKMLDDDIAGKLGRLDADQEMTRRRFAAENEPPEGLERVTHMINRWRNPERARQDDADLEQRRQEMEERLKKERIDYEDTLTNARDLNLENLAEGHAQQLRDHATKGEEDLERYAREQEAARRLLEEVKERERLEEQERKERGPEWPPPYTL